MRIGHRVFCFNPMIVLFYWTDILERSIILFFLYMMLATASILYVLLTSDKCHIPSVAPQNH